MSSAVAIEVKQEQPSADSVTDMIVSRSREPEHFLLKIESFSKSNLEKYESAEFEAAGYKWRMILYPNGDKERNGRNHISLFLSICDTENLRIGWAVEVDFCLFVYNSLSEKYLVYKFEGNGRFNWLRKELGFARLIPLVEFKDSSNGYLFGDTCVFGAEVYVTGSSVAKRQTLSMVKERNSISESNIFTWVVDKFSTLNGTKLKSKPFIIGCVQWNLELHIGVHGEWISIYLGE